MNALVVCTPPVSVIVAVTVTVPPMAGKVAGNSVTPENAGGMLSFVCVANPVAETTE